MDLPPGQAKNLQEAAWAARQKMDNKGGYLEVSPVPAPVLPALPKGEALSVSALEGTWTSEIRFYRVSPAQMILDLRESMTSEFHSGASVQRRIRCAERRKQFERAPIRLSSSEEPGA